MSNFRSTFGSKDELPGHSRDGSLKYICITIKLSTYILYKYVLITYVDVFRFK